MRSVRHIMLLGIAIALMSGTTACSAESAKEETHTVDWYMAPENKAALEAKLQECQNNPGELQNTPNCQNAKQADLKLFTSQPLINLR